MAKQPKTGTNGQLRGRPADPSMGEAVDDDSHDPGRLKAPGVAVQHGLKSATSVQQQSCRKRAGPGGSEHLEAKWKSYDLRFQHAITPACPPLSGAWACKAAPGTLYDGA
jgi:hypothetical protein